MSEERTEVEIIKGIKTFVGNKVEILNELVTDIVEAVKDKVENKKLEIDFEIRIVRTDETNKTDDDN